MVVGAAFAFLVLAITWLAFSGEYNFCGGFSYCWVTVDLMGLLAMSFLPFAVGWLWVLKGRSESSAHHADRFNDYMNILFAAAALCTLFVAQLMIAPIPPPPPGRHFYLVYYALHKLGDLRTFLIESCATFLAVLLVGFWRARQRA